MSNDSFKVKNSLNIQPVASASPTAKGDVVYDSSSDAIKYYNGSARTVVNTDEAQTLTNKTLTGNTAVNLVSGAATVTLPTTTSTLATLALSETLTNKTLTSPTINTPTIDVVTLDGQASAPSNPSAGFYKVYVDDTSTKLKLLDSSGNISTVGSGGGTKNYILYPDAESSTTGWATYADAAGTRPVDGTGGSPSSTWTASSSSPLSGSNSYLWTKSAANRQGEGVSYAFTIDSADQGKPLQIDFDWALVSGTWAGSTTPATDSDMIVYIYDVTNAVLIEPAGRLLESAITGMYYHYKSTFQSSINSTSYRLIIHTATTSASAYTLKFDSFQVGPQVIATGAVVTDWQAYTPTFTNFGTVTSINFNWRRTGDSVQIEGTCTLGTPSAAIGSISLPSGLSIDTAKLTYANTTANPGNMVGDYQIQAVTSSSGAIVTATGTSATVVYIGQIRSSNAAGGLTPQNGNILNASSVMSFYALIPISGWSSNVQMANDSSTRVVAASYYYAGGNGGTSVTALNPIDFSTKEDDTHAAVTTGTWKFTAPVAGIYVINGNISCSVAGNKIYIYKNNSSYRVIGSCGNSEGAYNYQLQLNAGDYIDIRMSSTATIYGTGHSTPAGTNVQIELLSGPSQVAASETIAASYYLSANFTSSSSTPINFDTKIYDTHGAVTPSATVWKFTAPAAGIYCMNLYTQYSGGAGSSSYIDVYKNGTKYMTIGFVSTSVPLASAGTIKLVAGDYIDFRTSSTFDNGGAALNATGPNVSIFRI